MIHLLIANNYYGRVENFTIRVLYGILKNQFGDVKTHIYDMYGKDIYHNVLKNCNDYFLKKLLKCKSTVERSSLLLGCSYWNINSDFIEKFTKNSEIDKEKDIVVCSVSSYLGFIYQVIPLLEMGYKLVVGGQFVNTMFKSIKELRKYVSSLVSNNNLMKNIIFIKGYLNNYVDLRYIFSKWTDFTIEQNFQIGDEYRFIIDPVIEKYSKSYEKFFTLFTSFGCPWSKCKYCLSTNDFTASSNLLTTDPVLLQTYIINLSEYYGTKNVQWMDSEVTLNSLDLVLKTGLENFIFEYIMCKISDFSNDNFIKKVEALLDRNYIRAFHIGLETCNNDTLRMSNRNYTVDIIRKAICNLQKLVVKYKNRFNLRIALIKNLPYINIESLRENYTMFFTFIKQIYGYSLDQYLDINKEKDIHVSINLNYLMLFKSCKMENSKYVKVISEEIDDEKVVGHFYFLKKYLKPEIYERVKSDKLLQAFNLPFYRITSDNQYLSAKIEEDIILSTIEKLKISDSFLYNML